MINKLGDKPDEILNPVSTLKDHGQLTKPSDFRVCIIQNRSRFLDPIEF